MKLKIGDILSISHSNGSKYSGRYKVTKLDKKNNLAHLENKDVVINSESCFFPNGVYSDYDDFSRSYKKIE